MTRTPKEKMQRAIKSMDTEFDHRLRKLDEEIQRLTTEAAHRTEDFRSARHELERNLDQRISRLGDDVREIGSRSSYTARQIGAFINRRESWLAFWKGSMWVTIGGLAFFGLVTGIAALTIGLCK